MERVKVNFNHNGVSCTGTVDRFDSSDLEDIVKTYFSWKDLNEVYSKYGIRRANFPELLSEGLTSVLFGYSRTNASSISGLSSSSMDLIDEQSGDTIQLKACSTDSKHKPGPTSFGPTSEFDKLIFMHIDCDTDTASWYELKADDYKNWKVNKSETIGDQQAQGRRPRVVILPKIKDDKLKPIKIFKFKT